MLSSNVQTEQLLGPEITKELVFGETAFAVPTSLLTCGTTNMDLQVNVEKD